jgi:hypothetical protein
MQADVEMLAPDLSYSSEDHPVTFYHSPPHLGNRQDTIPARPTVAQPSPLAYDYFRGWNVERSD